MTTIAVEKRNTMGKRGPKPEKGDSRQRIGNVEIQKGSTKDGHVVVQWDAIAECNEEGCNIFGVCPYDKHGKCRVRTEYMGYVHQIMHGQIDGANEICLFRLGMELIPLFNQLIDIKIAAFGATVTYATNRGMVMNPIFRELRACVKAISDTLNSLSNMGAFEKSGPKGVDTLTGDQDYYNALFQGTPKKETFKMRNRV